MLHWLDAIVIPFLTSLYGAVGYLGVAVAMAIESAMIPLPSELVLPYAGFLVGDPTQVDLPRDQLIVFTGLSGSGKSSLAFDTMYAEGQRRYVESLSAYARQFLGQMDKPDVDFIEGLSPAISIDQKSASRNPRSTVGTITEVYDYLRLLYARIGVQHCPNDGTRLQRQTPQQIVDRILQLPEGTRFQVLAPVVGAVVYYQVISAALAAIAVFRSLAHDRLGSPPPRFVPRT